MDEPLDKPGLGSRPAKFVPEAFPGFVCFPGVALVEEVESVEPVGMRGEEGGDYLAAERQILSKSHAWPLCVRSSKTARVD